MDELQARIDALDALIHQPMRIRPIPRKDDPEWCERYIKPIASMDGARMLINAIVGELTAEYVHHARALIRRPSDDYSRRELLETEAFVRTSFFAQLTQSEMDADTIINNMRRSVFNQQFRRYKGATKGMPKNKNAVKARERYREKCRKERGELWDAQNDVQRRET